jgi:hypothetical protein
MQKPLDAMRTHEATNSESKHQFLLDQQWQTMCSLLDILQPFNDTTECNSGQEYPTLGYVCVAFDGLVQHCQNVHDSSTLSLIKGLALTLKANMAKWLQHLQRTNGKMADLCIVVDP